MAKVPYIPYQHEQYYKAVFAEKSVQWSSCKFDCWIAFNPNPGEHFLKAPKNPCFSPLSLEFGSFLYIS